MVAGLQMINAVYLHAFVTCLVAERQYPFARSAIDSFSVVPKSTSVVHRKIEYTDGTVKKYVIRYEMDTTVPQMKASSNGSIDLWLPNESYQFQTDSQNTVSCIKYKSRLRIRDPFNGTQVSNILYFLRF